MDPTTKAGLVICGAVLFGFGLPILLYFAFRGQAMRGEIDAMRRAANATRQPLAKEADDLEELSRRVQALKKDQDKTGRHE